MTFTIPNNINSGDTLPPAVLGVINPDAASSTYQINLVGNVDRPSAPAPLPPCQRHPTPTGAMVTVCRTHAHMLRRRPGVQRSLALSFRLCRRWTRPESSRPRPAPRLRRQPDPEGGLSRVHPPE